MRKAVIKKRGTDKGFNGEGWWHRFLERYPELSLRKGDALALSRAAAITGNSMKRILACANAAGTTLPPMVIFDRQHFNPEWSKGEVHNTLYGMSDKG